METVKLALTATSAAVRTVTAVNYMRASYFSKQLGSTGSHKL